MGLRIRHIQTTTLRDADGTARTVPVLDADGQEIELYAVDVPQAVEARGGEAIDAYVAEQRAAPHTNQVMQVTEGGTP